MQNSTETSNGGVFVFSLPKFRLPDIWPISAVRKYNKLKIEEDARDRLELTILQGTQYAAELNIQINQISNDLQTNQKIINDKIDKGLVLEALEYAKKRFILEKNFKILSSIYHKINTFVNNLKLSKANEKYVNIVSNIVNTLKTNPTIGNVDRTDKKLEKVKEFSDLVNESTKTINEMQIHDVTERIDVETSKSDQELYAQKFMEDLMALKLNAIHTPVGLLNKVSEKIVQKEKRKSFSNENPKKNINNNNNNTNVVNLKPKSPKTKKTTSFDPKLKKVFVIGNEKDEDEDNNDDDDDDNSNNNSGMQERVDDRNIIINNKNVDNNKNIKV